MNSKCARANVEGKSFLLTTVYLWALIKKLKVAAAAPTGIEPSLAVEVGLCNRLLGGGAAVPWQITQSKAAANIEVEGTNIAASTIHAPGLSPNIVEQILISK